MLGTIVYCLLDIIFNVVFWGTKKTFNGVSMLYYYYKNMKEEEKKEINMFEIKKQMFYHSKMLNELKLKTKAV